MEIRQSDKSASLSAHRIPAPCFRLDTRDPSSMMTDSGIPSAIESNVKPIEPWKTRPKTLLTPRESLDL